MRWHDTDNISTNVVMNTNYGPISYGDSCNCSGCYHRRGRQCVVMEMIVEDNWTCEHWKEWEDAERQ